jgi:hypothetical protein
VGLIGQPIRLMDVENLEAFVQRTIDRSQIDYSPQEREELLAEGLTIAYELAGKYKPLPMRPGIDEEAGRFSGYLAMFLPRRLGDFWHKSHAEHRYVTHADGSRGWTYGAPVLSLDGLSQSGDSGDSYGGERHLLHARTLDAFCHATSAATLSLLGRVGSGLA